jgi:hypothetical protein
MEDLEKAEKMETASETTKPSVKTPEEPKFLKFYCSHSRFTKIDRTKFKDRIEFLKECRRCGLQRVFVTRRDFNSRNVYVKTEWYDVPKQRQGTQIDE